MVSVKFLFLALLLVPLVLACSEVGIGGKCHHRETGEVLTKVRDADGDLFSVKKISNFPGPTGPFDACGVSVEAKLVEEGGFFIAGYVYHPDTGERLAVYSAEKGLRLVGHHEWY